MPRILSLTAGVAAVITSPVSGAIPPTGAELDSICHIMLPMSSCVESRCVRADGLAGGADPDFSCAVADVSNSVEWFRAYSGAVEAALAASPLTDGSIRELCESQVHRFTTLEQIPFRAGHQCTFSALELTLGSDPNAFFAITGLVMAVPNLHSLRFDTSINMGTDVIVALLPQLGVEDDVLTAIHRVLAFDELMASGFRLHHDESVAHQDRIMSLVTSIGETMAAVVTAENRRQWCHFLFWLTSAVTQGIHDPRGIVGGPKVTADDGMSILAAAAGPGVDDDGACSIATVANAYKAKAEAGAIKGDFVLHWLGLAAAVRGMPIIADDLMVHPLFSPVAAQLPTDFFYYRQGVAKALDLARTVDAPCVAKILDRLHVAVGVGGVAPVASAEGQAIGRELQDYITAKAVIDEKAARMLARRRMFDKSATGIIGPHEYAPQDGLSGAIHTFLQSNHIKTE